jgi:hypothetical protein
MNTTELTVPEDFISEIVMRAKETTPSFFFEPICAKNAAIAAYRHLHPLGGEKGPKWDISITKEQAVVIKDTLEGVIKLAGRMGSKQPFEENLVLQYLNEKLEIPSTREEVNDKNK